MRYLLNLPPMPATALGSSISIGGWLGLSLRNPRFQTVVSALISKFQNL